MICKIFTTKNTFIYIIQIINWNYVINSIFHFIKSKYKLIYWYNIIFIFKSLILLMKLIREVFQHI